MEEAEWLWKLGMIKEEEVRELTQKMLDKYHHEWDQIINLEDYESDDDISQ